MLRQPNIWRALREREPGHYIVRQEPRNDTGKDHPWIRVRMDPYTYKLHCEGCLKGICAHIFAVRAMLDRIGMEYS